MSAGRRTDAPGRGLRDPDAHPGMGLGLRLGHPRHHLLDEGLPVREALVQVAQGQDLDGGEGPEREAAHDGIEFLENFLGDTYKLYGKPENFVSVLYANTGHEYLPEMRVRMLEWFRKHLPIEK